MTTPARELFSAALRRLMEAAKQREPGLTSEALAGRMIPELEPHVAWSTVRRYFSGDRQARFERLDTIAAALDCKVAELFAEPES